MRIFRQNTLREYESVNYFPAFSGAFGTFPKKWPNRVAKWRNRAVWAAVIMSTISSHVVLFYFMWTPNPNGFYSWFPTNRGSNFMISCSSIYPITNSHSPLVGQVTQPPLSPWGTCWGIPVACIGWDSVSWAVVWPAKESQGFNPSLTEHRPTSTPRA